MLEFNSYDDLLEAFPNERKALDYLENIRWNGIVISPFSPNSKVYYCSSNKYKCRDTGKYFNAKTNTIFHNSRIALHKWFRAIWIMSIEKSDITSVDLAKNLGITQKSAWYMMQRIREYFEIKKSATKTTRKHPIKKNLEVMEVITDSEKLKMSEWLNILKK